ncbi:sulfatase-like hydrolase/transferase [candidate division KSB1 bacterium]|nr:sulfatase-like hydrolase/transferase [candidate division KSB1 bacterium]
MRRRDFLKYCSLFPLLWRCSAHRTFFKQPNILLLMSDNHCWNHLGCYGDSVVRTPHIDGIAEQGIRFSHAFCSAPSCTPARAGLLTGQDIWRLEQGANLWGILPKKFITFVDRLHAAGYHVGYQGKGWGPGSYKAAGRTQNPAGKKFESFSSFLSANPGNRPWFYWFSSRNPHRPYDVGSGIKAGLDPGNVTVPSYLPDIPDVRKDICDYYREIERFDQQVGDFLNVLKANRQSENTLIIVCSDNGWQMPRGLANLYDFGTRIPLVFSWPDTMPSGRVVDDFVNLNDLAPTILDLANADSLPDMTAKSLLSILLSNKEGRLDPDRNHIVTGRERHAWCRRDGLGYPARALRTDRFLYIRNFEPDRWPAGDPPLFGDVDAHMLHYPCPTKLFILENRNDAKYRSFFELGFAKRPAEELYDLSVDADQIHNVAGHPQYRQIKEKLRQRLDDYLINTKDPRLTGGELIWDTARYFAKKDFTPKPSQQARQRLGLKQEYHL